MSIIPQTSTQMILWKNLCNVGNCLLGEITSFQLVYSKGIESIFLQVCIALRIFVGGERDFSSNFL